MSPTTQLSVTLLLFAIVPLWILRGDALRRHVLWQGSFALVVLVSLNLLPRFGVAIDSWTVVASTIVGSLGVLASVVYCADESEISFGSVRAFVFFALVASLALPFMERFALDGDEPYYFLQSESLLRDHDLDLRNQYAQLDRSEVGRRDLIPQQGDPVGAHGEQYSRHEPLLALLLLPGVAWWGKWGALATMALFGALLAWSLTKLLGEEGFSERDTLLTMVAALLLSPIFFYSLRIWPEVPAAFAFCQALRALRREQNKRFLFFILLLSLLKLRFVLITLPLVIVFVRKQRDAKRIALVTAILLFPLALIWWINGSPLNVHQGSELLLVKSASSFLNGFFGLLLDAQHGLLFVAPIFFFALLIALRDRQVGSTARIAMLAMLPYLLLLFPRAEWHGGWSPPMRYLVVAAPLFALLAARLVAGADATLLTLSALWSSGFFLHGLLRPFALFHLENGESTLGEYLSAQSRSDYSRLLPSFVRVNDAAIVAAILFALTILFLMLVGARFRRPFGSSSVVLVTAALIAFAWAAPHPGRRVDFEDAHVQKRGGALYPHQWTVARFLYSGGWRMNEGGTVHFRMAEGKAELRYIASAPFTLQVDGTDQLIAPSNGFGLASLTFHPKNGYSTVAMVRGAAVLDRVIHE